METVSQGSYTRAYDGRPSPEHVIFRTDAIQDFAKSQDAGRPIFKDAEFVEIHFPGDTTKVVVQRVRQEHIDRWPRQYEAFKAGRPAHLEGTPLSAWTALTKAQVKEFEALNIWTVEQLSNVPDNALKNLGMGGRTWRDRAKAFIDAAADNAILDKLAAESTRKDEEIAELKRQMAELTAAVKASRPDVEEKPLETALAESGEYIEPVRRGPGRPRKEAA